MRWKEIAEDASGSQPPGGWAKELDRGIDDVDHGRVIPVSDVIADLDATLAEMANDTDDQVGHGNNISNRTTTDKRSQS